MEITHILHPVPFLLCQVQMSSVEKGCCESLQRRRFLKKLPPVDLRRCWPGPKTKASASHIAGYLAGRKGHIAPELLNIYLGRQVRCQGQTASTPTFSKRGHLPPRAIARRTEEKGMQTRRNFLGSLFPHNRPAQLFPSVCARGGCRWWWWVGARPVSPQNPQCSLNTNPSQLQKSLPARSCSI